jgi:hypothetical protein
MDQQDRKQHILDRIKETIIWKKQKDLQEESIFYIYRTDTGATIASNIVGFENAKSKATDLRKKYGLKFDQVKFKAQRRYGISQDGKKYTDSTGKQGRVEYSPVYNPSKRGHFKGVWGKDGSYHDLS